MRVFHASIYVRALILRTKVVINEQEKFWPFWLRPKATPGNLWFQAFLIRWGFRIFMEKTAETTDYTDFTD